MSNFFINTTKDFKLKEDNSSSALGNVLKVFNAYPSVERNNGNIEINQNLPFQQVTEDLVQNFVLNLDSFKAILAEDSPADMLKSTVDINLPFITKVINISFNPFVFNAPFSTPWKHQKNDDLD